MADSSRLLKNTLLFWSLMLAAGASLLRLKAKHGAAAWDHVKRTADFRGKGVHLTLGGTVVTPPQPFALPEKCLQSLRSLADRVRAARTAWKERRAL